VLFDVFTEFYFSPEFGPDFISQDPQSFFIYCGDRCYPDQEGLIVQTERIIAFAAASDSYQIKVGIGGGKKLRGGT
jgi:hypothetical protein